MHIKVECYQRTRSIENKLRFIIMKIALTDITRCFALAKHRLIYLLKFSSKLVVRRAQSPIRRRTHNNTFTNFY